MFFFPLKHPTEKSRGGAAFAALKKCGTFENGRQLITTEKEHDSIFYDSYDSFLKKIQKENSITRVVGVVLLFYYSFTPLLFYTTLCRRRFFSHFVFVFCVVLLLLFLLRRRCVRGRRRSRRRGRERLSGDT